MSVHVDFLSQKDFSRIYAAFVQAFSDYALDMSYLTERALLNRCIKNGVDFESSVGAFDADTMVGFTLIGLDDWLGKPAAFDAGTGIIAEYRGKGIAGAMFDRALPRLREKRIRRVLLEVLQQNRAAITAYRAAGFTPTRELDCFELPLNQVRTRGESDGTAVEPADRTILFEFERHLDWTPSWENSIASIMRIPDEVVILSANLGGRPAGVLAYYPLLNWIVRLVVKKEFRRRGIAMRLVAELAGQLQNCRQNVKLVNVDRSDAAMLSFLVHAGFDRYAAQYEMELLLG